MKAVIMAGGEGSRLRPLTCDIPKPMARLCGRPILVYILDLLKANNVESAVLTTRYLPNQISEYFKESEYQGMPLEFSQEDEPLGTAGSVKAAAKNFSAPFFIISGDALCDIDLQAAYAYHQAKGADATIITTKVADPREYGLVSYDENGNIIGFLEKPGWNQAATDAANTGIYILNSAVLDMIPENKAYDFGKELFPQMLAAGKRLCAYESDKYWCDIGDLETYLSCQSDMIIGKVKAKIPGANDDNIGLIITKSSKPTGEYEIIPPCYIGSNVSIGNGSVIGPNTIIDDNVTIGEYSKIRGSVILKNSYLGQRCRLTGAIVCSGASLKTGACMFEGSVIGSNVKVGSLSEISPNIKVWPGKEIEDNTVVKENFQYGNGKLDIFDDEGIIGEAGIDLTPEFCARLGAACGSLPSGKRVGVACGNGKAAKAFRSAFIAGVLSTGSQVWDFGEVLESQAAFATSYCGLSVCVYISVGSKCNIQIYSESGLPAGRVLERDITGVLQRGEFKRCTWDNYKEAADMFGMRLLYQQHLYSLASAGLKGMSAQARCVNSEGEQLFEDTLIRLGCATDSGMILNLSKTGRALSITDSVLGFISEDRVLMLCCLIDLKQGLDIYLPFEAPQAINEMAQKYGRTVERYLYSPANDIDKEIRKKSSNQMWLRDGIMAGIRVLDYVKRSGEDLAILNRELPIYSVFSKQFEIDVPPSKMLTHLGSSASAVHEGVVIKLPKGSVLVRPSKKGKRINLFAESTSAEIAEEICDIVEAQLKQ